MTRMKSFSSRVALVAVLGVLIGLGADLATAVPVAAAEPPIVRSFGGAHFYGSTGGSWLFASIAGMTTSPSGSGYWLAAADGRVFSFGSAPAMAGVTPSSPIAGVQVAPGGTGLWLVARDGAVYTT